MEREILFKAKRLDNGKWVVGDLLHTGDVDAVLISDCYSQLYRCDSDTICQYTGLTDKNGKKIWENDILKANLDESHPEDITYIKILWNECRFCVNENYSTDIDALEKWDAEHFQVCGNIFDNADLLEVE